MAKLIAQSGHTLDLPRRRVSLGESASCDVPLSAGLGLAPLHFEIEPRPDGNYIVRDVSGGAGLTVNDQAVQEMVLQHGNVIGAGMLRLGFWHTEVPQEAPSPFLAGARGVVQEEEEAQPAAKFIPIAPLAASGERTHSPEAAKPGASPPTAPVPASPPPVPATAAAPRTEGPPVAWMNPADEKAASLAMAAQAAAAGGNIPPEPAAPVDLPANNKRTRVRSTRRSRFSRRTVVLASLAVVAGAGAAASRLEPVRNAFAPVWEKITAWANPPKPEPRPASTTATATVTTQKPQTPPPDRNVLPKAEHNEIVKRMLTERTISLFQADLRQLVPFYNATASTQKLPPQREMNEAFSKHYGLLLEGFDRLTCLRASGKDEFVFILTSPTQVNIESLLSIPPAPVKEDTRTKSKVPRIYPVKLTGKVYGATQYDPFTVILGRPSWIESTLNGGSSPSLREALCMFPFTAVKNPGALIMVERITHPSDASPSAFQTAVSNLFFKDKGESRLTLTRNPDVKEEVFVEQSSAALKEQSSALYQSLKLSGVTALAEGPARTLGKAPDAGEMITTTEASITVPDGEALLREAIESVAHSFMSQSPSVELILAAQKAVLNFNQARLKQAPETMTVTSVAEALELLQGGISAGQQVYQIERLEPAQADEIVHLLAMEDRAGLVFRPSTDHLNGTMLDLAIKARDYRNAELLISLWAVAKFTKEDAQDAATAARKVLEWANKDGARQRISVGLPTLTDVEREHATALLSFQNGQLTWKPGEEGYRTWLRKVNPDPKGDAKRIAGIFSQAMKAGAIPTGKVAELADAVRLISAGVSSGTTDRVPTVFKAGNYTNDELRAATRYLRLEGGSMRVIDR
ncbi:MAG TPA: FHA domain-containing protein [Verrucomicrobiales bacterium]|nr:FHA domain-containing protein [Verrucomicrobiales bacterium]